LEGVSDGLVIFHNAYVEIEQVVAEVDMPLHVGLVITDFNWGVEAEAGLHDWSSVFKARVWSTTRQLEAASKQPETQSAPPVQSPVSMGMFQSAEAWLQPQLPK
jgi:hypothetical protein